MRVCMEQVYTTTLVTAWTFGAHCRAGARLDTGGSEIVALPEFGYGSRRRIAQGLRRADWSDPGELEAAIRRSRPSAVVYGVPTQTVSQMRDLTRDPALRATLERSYVRREVGEFTVWLRAE